tara:strand:+ start:977 stop:1105 length:129 start_codon:yes stop_codon:yes gene_type:complete
MSSLLRLSPVPFFLMYGMSGAAANVEKKVVKKPNHAEWKARM